MEKIIIAILGAPGSGKSTVRKMIYRELVNFYKVPQNEIQTFSVGELIRKRINEDGEYALRNAQIIRDGLFIPTSEWESMLAEMLSNKFQITVFDGYLVNVEAIKCFIKLTHAIKTFIFCCETSVVEILRRIKHRVVCPSCSFCGNDCFSLCPNCGKTLVRRPDDKNILERLEKYTQTAQVQKNLLMSEYGDNFRIIPYEVPYRVSVSLLCSQLIGRYI